MAMILETISRAPQARKQAKQTSQLAPIPRMKIACQGGWTTFVGLYIWKSMIPALLGNMVGGGLFVGVVYWYLYLAGNPSPVLIDGSAFGGDPVALFGVNADVEEERSRRESDKTDMA